MNAQNSIKYFKNYVVALSIRGGNKHGNMIRLYSKKEFNTINQQWYITCSFPQILDWLSVDKENKSRMFFDGKAVKKYILDEEFRTYIKSRNLEQYFEYKSDNDLINFFFPESK